MMTVKVRREEHFVADEREPLLLKLSRVPCVGEHVSITNATRGGKNAQLAGFYVVTMVLHAAMSRDDSIAADVNITAASS